MPVTGVDETMTTPQITALPPAPTPQDSPEAFNDKAFRVLAAQEAFVEEANELAEFVNQKTSDAAAASVSAGQAAQSAEVARDDAIAAKNVVVGVASQFGDVGSAIAFAEDAAQRSFTQAQVAANASQVAELARDAATVAKNAAVAAEQSIDSRAEQITTDATLAAVGAVTTQVESARDVAVAAKDGAELARDAAVAAAGPLYATVEEGRSAVSDGEIFKVMGTGDVAVLLYRRNSASESSLISSFLSQSGIEKRNAITSNATSNYPFVARRRNNIDPASLTAVEETWTKRCILDVRIENARPGYYYRVAAASPPTNAQYPCRWIIEECPIEGFESSDNAVRVVAHTHPMPLYVKSTGIQTIVLTPPNDPHKDIRIYVTLNTDVVSTGNLNGTQTTSPYYGWIIDPSRYSLNETLVAAKAYSDSAAETAKQLAIAATKTQQYAIYNATGTLHVRYKAGDYIINVNFMRNGANALPNIRSVSYAHKGSPDSFVQLHGGDTDWLPPLNVMAYANGDGGASQYTGGNHLGEGTALGLKTAVNVSYDMYIDGVLWVGEPVFGFPSCQKIEIYVVNDIYAYNTITLQRPVIRQYFSILFEDGVMSVRCKCVALENCTVNTDNGPQTVTSGFVTGTQRILEAENANRTAYGEVTNSGVFANFPKAWALIFNRPEVQQVTFVDRVFGLGNGAQIGGTAGAFRKHVTNDKWYAAIIAGRPLVMGAGDSYEWHGGYSWQATGAKPQLADCSFLFYESKPMRCVAYVDGYMKR